MEKKSEKVEQVEPYSFCSVSIHHLLACLSCVPDPKIDFPALKGVHLKRSGKDLHVVGFDMKHMLLATEELGEERPPWLEAGLTLPDKGLKQRLKICAESGMTVRIGWGLNQPKVVMLAENGHDTFQFNRIEVKYVDYAEGMNILVGDLTRDNVDAFKPIGVQSKLFKHVEEVSNYLVASLDAAQKKEMKAKDGISVRYFEGKGEVIVFDFPDFPNILMVLARKNVDEQIGLTMGKILKPVLLSSVAALKAHATRNKRWAEMTDDPTEKAHFEAKEQEFRDKIADAMKRAPILGALPKPEPKPAPTPEPVVKAKAITKRRKKKKAA